MDDYDVIVVGGGPGGSTVAGLTAAEGHRVLLVDKDVFPRYQIGESLLPATIHGICALLGVREEIERAGFVRKGGGTFKWGTSAEPWTFSFAASERMAGPTSYAYQVERSRFDLVLLDGARRLGAEVRQGHRALGTIREGDRITGVRYADDTGRERLATARFVVDASGHGSRLHHDVGGAREYSPHFRNLALFGYFEGGHRMPAPHAGNILCVSFADGWFWYIPLSDTLTSVGAVVKQESATRVQGDPDVAYASLIDDCPLIAEFLRDAHRATEPPYDRLRVRKDYSYDRTVLWCPGMVLVGDAACFIDPVFSSGVHLATYSALLAARSINTTLAGLGEESRCFTEFEARYRREFSLFRDFLLTFYELDTGEDDYFRQARRLISSHGAADEAFADLVGGVSSQDFSRGMFGNVLAEGVQLQLRGLLGGAAGDEPPMFPGGLVPTADGRRWRVPDA
ncbi:tryptophan 7-halogenase [Amycolatopsis regifaucium]|uniref:Tryptophan halogenase n=1 Tax=Amycolatopsis regifaucium TaxID=546365 RepID=A0A154M575_9PSEU|nr:tryptophan 7-halogenase [Amycolatopsis regifaucium]KZB79716.1 tryptophan halogenase [Amycolatopsis regifaucium]OKA09969.1 tryptophan halogenase [Amycolatopsis regifaucium]SFI66852.1 halogenation protein CepH [Amycolatopsis regifaucium]